MEHHPIRSMRSFHHPASSSMAEREWGDAGAGCLEYSLPMHVMVVVRLRGTQRKAASLRIGMISPG